MNDDGVKDSEQIFKGLDTLDSILKKIKKRNDDDDEEGVYVKDVYIYKDDLAEELNKVNDSKAQNAKVCIYFIEKLAG